MSDDKNSAAPPARHSMWKTILLSAVALIAILVLVVAMQPADFRISRSAVIEAAPNVVFEHVNDLQKWQEWSPWAKLDPNAKVQFTGPVAGKDAAFAWSGNNEVGEGTMTIIESKPTELVRFRLEFKKPMVATNEADFTFVPDGNKTKVTWTMTGKNDFMGKAFNLLIDCDKMVGDQFNQGFINLGNVVQEK
jgi:Polyketide cyclase / dehydrase and lipid transport